MQAKQKQSMKLKKYELPKGKDNKNEQKNQSKANTKPQKIKKHKCRKGNRVGIKEIIIKQVDKGEEDEKEINEEEEEGKENGFEKSPSQLEKNTGKALQQVYPAASASSELSSSPKFFSRKKTSEAIPKHEAVKKLKL
ncbi:MAG: hypothetical protein K0R24_331 [Gammaproteobacteria bacterium]|jgi:hypothetical protein|nr:hypothetical protein [Gammaproteobacteria bacterium]